MDQYKNIFVVGGASGIGRSVCLQLLKGQAQVIIADSDSAKLDEMGQMCRGQDGTNSELVHLDITDRASRTGCLNTVREKYKHLDAIVISAGVHSAYPAEYLTDEAIDHVLDVNLLSHIKLVRDMLPLVKEGGRIVAVSSIAAGIGVPMESMYSASKAGLEAFYESLAAEISYRKIKCVIIHPGNVNTGFNEKGNDYQPCGNEFIDGGYQRVVSGIDSSKGMDPDEVACIIVKALQSASPRFSYIVGPNAQKAYWAKRILGRDLALKLMGKYFGFNL